MLLASHAAGIQAAQHRAGQMERSAMYGAWLLVLGSWPGESVMVRWSVSGQTLMGPPHPNRTPPIGHSPWKTTHPSIPLRTHAPPKCLASVPKFFSKIPASTNVQVKNSLACGEHHGYQTAQYRSLQRMPALSEFAQRGLSVPGD